MAYCPRRRMVPSGWCLAARLFGHVRGQTPVMSVLEVVERVDGGAVDSHLEVEVAARGVAGRADGADHLSLRNGAAGHVEGRLVRARRGEAPAVVDDDEVPVTIHPAG